MFLSGNINRIDMFIVGYLSLLWAGISLGVVHDAVVKFSTPEVQRSDLLRVGMHLFASYRRLETGISCLLVTVEANNIISNPGSVAKWNKPLLSALLLRTFRTYLFPEPYLIQAGKFVINNIETGGENKLSKKRFPILSLAHKVAVCCEFFKIGFLLIAADVAFRN